MASQPDRSPTQLREAVTSPGGTTAAALDVLRGQGGLAPLMEQAVLAARKAGRRVGWLGSSGGNEVGVASESGTPPALPQMQESVAQSDLPGSVPLGYIALTR